MTKTTIKKISGQNTFVVKSGSAKTAKNAVKKRFGRKVMITQINKSPSWAGDGTNRNLYWVMFKVRGKK